MSLSQNPNHQTPTPRHTLHQPYPYPQRRYTTSLTSAEASLLTCLSLNTLPCNSNKRNSCSLVRARVCVKMPTGFPLVMLTHLSNFLSFISSSTKNRTHTRGAGALFRTKNGLGISSVSGFQTGGSPFSFSAILAAKALPFGSGLRLPSSIGRPPALACASSTSVLPLGARLPPLEALMAMLFFVAILFKSSPPLAFFLVRLDLRVGERGIFS